MLEESGMKSFKTYITEDNTRYVDNIVKKYKIPDELIEYKSEQKLVIQLPASPTRNEKPDPHPSVAKLLKDLRSGRLRPDRMMSYTIKDYYANKNDVTMSFANERVTRPPKKLYHWTKAENVDSILKNGIKPSSGNWSIGQGGDSEVTYNAVFLVKARGKLSKNRGFEQYKKPKYQAIEVTDTDQLTLYKDPHRYDPDPTSLVSYETIPAKHLSLKE